MRRLLLILAIFALMLLNYGWANNSPTLTKIEVSPQPAIISSPISVSINLPKHIQGSSCVNVFARALDRAQRKLNNSLTEAQKRFLETAFPE